MKETELLILFNVNFEKINVKEIEIPYNLKFLVIHEVDSPQKDLENLYTSKKKFFKKYILEQIDKFKIPFGCAVLFYGIYNFHNKFYEINYFSESLNMLVISLCDFEIADKNIYHIIHELTIAYETKLKLIKLYCKERPAYELYKLHDEKLKMKIYNDIKIFKVNSQNEKYIDLNKN